MYNGAIKRILDFTLALLGLIVLSPLFIALILSVKLDSSGPVFFTQKRIGRKKETFNIFKFRTMRSDTPGDVPTHMLKNPDSFITRTGRFLRRTSLDELPQLFNILRGEMSFVGPRPALWNQDDLVNYREQYGANDVRPGLTGLAQIKGRDELPIEIKARYDGTYVQHITFSGDIKILFGTVTKVAKAEGIKEGKSVQDEETK